MREQYTVFDSNGEPCRIINATQDEIAFKVSGGETYQKGLIKKVDVLTEIRLLRDKMLSESDWTQVNDAPVDRDAWANYRQALRDLPETYANETDIGNVVFPTAP